MAASTLSPALVEEPTAAVVAGALVQTQRLLLKLVVGTLEALVGALPPAPVLVALVVTHLAQLLWKQKQKYTSGTSIRKKNQKYKPQRKLG